MSARIVITGIGVISSVGCGREAFWRALWERMGVAQTDSLPYTPTRPHAHTPIHTIPDFDARDYLTHKGVKFLSRSAQMACAATALAWGDARLDDAALPPDRVGVVMGSAYANVNSMVAFDREAHEVGARFVSATLFPDTLLNAPAGHISILFGWTGINSTVCSGCASSIGAMRCGVAALPRGAADVMLVGGCEEWSQWVVQGLEVETGQRVNGLTGQRKPRLGEGAAVLVLERWEDAQRREATMWAEVAGCGASFAAHSSDEETVVEAQVRAIQQALASASLTADDIFAVFRSASGEREPRENLALERVFGERMRTLSVRDLPSSLGALCGATGAFLVAAAVSALQRGRRAVLVNTLSNGGHNATAALKRVLGSGL